ncbi:MAG TPA: retropepsin-like aspartic protease [Terracidiphilus sp.]|nr:retropepsin-like aspartic protease [Terracidiphilus sp.]
MPTAPAPDPAPSTTSQQVGADAQVHTGTSSGLDTEARLRNLLADHQYMRVQAQLDQLPPEAAQFYRGILANRSNQLQQSVELLEPLVDAVTASGDTEREKMLRMTLAEDYLRLGDWTKAAQAYQILDDRLGAKLTPGEQDEIEMPLKMLPLVKDNPPVTIDPCEPFRLQVSNDPLGLIDVPVFIDARSHSWMLDPTAPFNLISRSIAQYVGLEISENSATIRTLTGRPIEVHSTVIPRLTIGGRLTLHNVTAFVFKDDDYSFPDSGYRVEGVLGYPALAAMGRITVADNTIQVDPAKEADAPADQDRLNTGAQFYLDGDEIIVALGRTWDHATDSDSQAAASSSASDNDYRMFAIDAGGQQTYLTSRWFNEHAAEFNGKKMEPFSFPGMDSGPRSAFVAETVPLAIGNKTVELHYIPVLPQPLGSAARDDVYGVIGIDGLDQLNSYTFDYRTMRFSATSE